MQRKEAVSNFTKGRYGSKHKKNNSCTGSVRNSQHLVEKGVRGEFSKQTHSDKKNVHSAERKQSQSFKANNKPDSEESFPHSAETTEKDSVSETDNERELSDN